MTTTWDKAPVGDVPEIEARRHAKLRERIPALASLVDRLRDPGPRLATGVRTLDTACRGGFQRGRRVFLLGAPSAAKTTFAMTLALKWARDGHRVAWLAVDEEAADLLIRLGQMLGLERDAIEAGDDEELARLEAALAALPGLSILDADAGCTIEDAIDLLDDRPPGVAGVLIVDSLQSAAEAMPGEGPRARVDAVVRLLRHASGRRLIVIVTSEMNRSSYASRNPADRIDPLAGGKESGAIEYAAKTQLVLTEVPNRVGEIDVAIRKNRGGSKEPFRLRIDFARARVEEIQMPAAAAEVARDPSAVWVQYKTKVRTALAEHPDGYAGGAEGLAKQLGIRRVDVAAALKGLLEAGEVRDNERSGKARRLYLCGDSRPADESPSQLIDTRPEYPSPLRERDGYHGTSDSRPGRHWDGNGTAIASREPGEDDGDEEGLR